LCTKHIGIYFVITKLKLNFFIESWLVVYNIKFGFFATPAIHLYAPAEFIKNHGFWFSITEHKYELRLNGYAEKQM
jgi:hypothetical protein